MDQTNPTADVTTQDPTQDAQDQAQSAPQASTQASPPADGSSASSEPAADAQPQQPAESVDAAAIPAAPDHFDATVASRMRHMFGRVWYAVEAKLEREVRDELAHIPTLHLPEMAVRYRDELVTHLDALIAKNEQEAAQ